MIVYGISEKRDADGRATGIPDAIVGIGDLNADKVTLQYTQRLRDALNPPLTRVTMQAVEVDGRNVFVLGSGKSLVGPHAVWLDRSGKFFRRNTNGKYQMETSELRSVFLEQLEWRRESETFRRERIAKALRKEVCGDPSAVACATFLHVLPLGRLEEDVGVLNQGWQKLAAYLGSQLKLAGIDYRPVLDGFLTYGDKGKGVAPAYIQLFRCGGIECFNGRLCVEVNGKPQLRLVGLESALRAWGRLAISVMRDRFNMSAPLVAYLTIVRTRGIEPVYHDSIAFTETGVPFLENELWFPGVLLDDEDLVAPEPLAELMRLSWFAAGVDPPQRLSAP